jgi:hypothetical protein
VTLPWEPDSSQIVTGPNEPVWKALITIEVNTPGGRLVVPIATLHGSKLSPNHTKVLRLGARAEILARGNWNFLATSSEDLRKAGLLPNVEVKARMIFATDIDGHVYADLVSKNSVSLVLERQPRR